MTPAQLKRIRQKLGLTQSELGAQLGVTQNTVARWETSVRGIPEPTARLIERLVAESKPKRRK
jgi:transcriptional regulator with XRE-family HTH domain